VKTSIKNSEWRSILIHPWVSHIHASFWTFFLPFQSIAACADRKERNCYSVPLPPWVLIWLGLTSSTGEKIFFNNPPFVSSWRRERVWNQGRQLKMLSKLTIKSLNLSFKLSCFFKACPFQWNPQKQTLRLDLRKRAGFLFLCSTILNLLHFCFVAFRSVDSLLVHPTSAPILILEFGFVCQSFFSFAIQLNTCYRKQEMLEFTNLCLKLERSLTGNIFVQLEWNNSDNANLGLFYNVNLRI